MPDFVDQAQVHAKGGDGGAGSVSFRREAHVARGGPDGGDGGSGGDVWLVADHNVSSLLAFRDHPHRRATDGGHGQGKGRHGAHGADTAAPVPEGTIVRDRGGTVLADLVHSGDRYLAAEGGRGGRGNARFLTNRRRAPRFAEQGEVGDEQWLDLELRLMADVALVGFPNAGKSTLIARMSAARPKIADYPFTTLVPNLGVVRMPDGADLVVADVPGLIEGASEGRGLGHQFLRHVERARALVVLADLASFERAPGDQVRVLLRELGAHRPDLLDRPRIEVGSRADAAHHEWDGLCVSGVTGEGLDELVGRMAGAVAEARLAATPGHRQYVVHRPEPEGVRVERLGDGAFQVHGRDAERAVALSDLTDPQAIEVVHERLTRLGVTRALTRAGVDTGDTVRVGRLTFEWQEDELS